MLKEALCPTVSRFYLGVKIPTLPPIATGLRFQEGAAWVLKADSTTLVVTSLSWSIPAAQTLFKSCSSSLGQKSAIYEKLNTDLHD